MSVLLALEGDTFLDIKVGDSYKKYHIPRGCWLAFEGDVLHRGPASRTRNHRLHINLDMDAVAFDGDTHFPLRQPTTRLS